MKIFISILLFCQLLKPAIGQSSFSIELPKNYIDNVSEVLMVGDHAGIVLGKVSDSLALFPLSKIYLDKWRLQINLKSDDIAVSDRSWLDKHSKVRAQESTKRWKLSILDEDSQQLNEDIEQQLSKIKDLENASSAADSILANQLPDNVGNGYGYGLIASYISRNRNDPTKIKYLDDLVYQSLIAKNRLDYLKLLIDMYVDTITYDFGEVSLSKYDRDSTSEVESLNKFSGKKVIIDWWFSGCPPCVADHETILKENYIEKGVFNDYELVGISVDIIKKPWQEYLEKHNISWDNYIIKSSNYEYEKDHLNTKILSAYPTYMIVEDNKMVYVTNILSEVVSYVQNRK
ncbi:MAG: redoxin family protein [Bacteroidota bacterium]